MRSATAAYCSAVDVSAALTALPIEYHHPPRLGVGIEVDTVLSRRHRNNIQYGILGIGRHAFVRINLRGAQDLDRGVAVQLRDSFDHFRIHSHLESQRLNGRKWLVTLCTGSGAMHDPHHGTVCAPLSQTVGVY
jgi:hypothetical protein